MERQGERDDQVQSREPLPGRQARESYLSKGSEDEIKDAIQKYTSDEKI